MLEARDMNHAIQLMSQHPALKYGARFETHPTFDLREMIQQSEQRRRKAAADEGGAKVQYREVVVSQFESRDLEADLWLLATPTMRRAESVHPHLRARSAQSYSEEPGKGDLQHAETCLRIGPVPGWLRRPPELLPSPALFHHFIEHVRDLAAIVYGRLMYEVKRYWDEGLADWDAEERDFGVAWRSQPKWVVSRALR